MGRKRTKDRVPPVPAWNLLKVPGRLCSYILVTGSRNRFTAFSTKVTLKVSRPFGIVSTVHFNKLSLLDLI